MGVETGSSDGGGTRSLNRGRRKDGLPSFQEDFPGNVGGTAFLEPAVLKVCIERRVRGGIDEDGRAAVGLEFEEAFCGNHERTETLRHAFFSAEYEDVAGTRPLRFECGALGRRIQTPTDGVLVYGLQSG